MVDLYFETGLYHSRLFFTHCGPDDRIEAETFTSTLMVPHLPSCIHLAASVR
jgi:hypothetical protein